MGIVIDETEPAAAATAATIATGKTTKHSIEEIASPFRTIGRLLRSNK